MPLPLFRIFLASYAVLWSRRSRASRQLLAPCVILALVLTALEKDWFGSGQAVDSLMSFLSFVPMAVILRTTQRLVLVGRSEHGVDAQGNLARVHIRYYGWLIGIICLCCCVLLVGVIAFYFVGGPVRESALLMPLWLASFYLWSRISLVLPACAMNLDCSLESAWHLGAGNALRLFALMGTSFILIPGLLMNGLRYTGLDIAFAFNFLGALMLCPGAAALALSWHELNRERSGA